MAEDKIPWQKINNGEKLSEGHKQLVTKVLKTTRGYAFCEDTIFNCLQQYPSNESILRQASYIVRRSKIEKNVDQIKLAFQKRIYSLYNPKRHQPNVEKMQYSGDPKAPIVVVAYADFECPYCKIAVPALRRISQERPDFMVLYFKNFPIKSHKNALPASKALVAADNQGKFWEMLDILYKQTDFSNENLNKIATYLKLDLVKFKNDIDDKKTLARIKKEKLEAMTFDIFSTPGILINGKLYNGPKSYAELLDILEEELDIVQGRQ